MAYKNFVGNVSKQVDGLFASISARYNFDLGEEFELAVCDSLANSPPVGCGRDAGSHIGKLVVADVRSGLFAS